MFIPASFFGKVLSGVMCVELDIDYIILSTINS